jgi:hypothetical protein
MSGRHGHGGQGGQGGPGGYLDMVPMHLDYAASSPFIDRPISALRMLNGEPTVQQYLHANPQAQQGILELSRTVGGIGARVRDANGPHIVIDDSLKYYSADEIWMFDLIIDVMAMLVTGGGLRPDNHDRVFDELRSADKHRKSAHWRRQVHKAGAGPTQFRQLRELIPQHQPLG